MNFFHPYKVIDPLASDRMFNPVNLDLVAKFHCFEGLAGLTFPYVIVFWSDGNTVLQTWNFMKEEEAIYSKLKIYLYNL